MSASTLRKKVDKQLTSHVDKPEFLDSLQYLSTFYEDNSLQNRRNLSKMLQKQRRDLNLQVLQAFKPVYEEFSLLTSSINSLMNDCDEIAQRLDESKTQTEQLFKQTQNLDEQRKGINRKEVIVEEFLSHFHLTEEENEILNLLEHEREVTPEVFIVVSRIIRIREDCKELMENYHQRAGLDILDYLGNRLEKCYDQIYHWTQEQVRQPEQNCDLNLLSKSLDALKSFPAYFEHCTTELSSTKRTEIVRKFIQSMTRGGEHGGRPIELHANEPVRYVSDILAWVHQELAGLREFTIMVFGSGGKIENADQITQFLDCVMSAISRPLSSRLESTLERINQSSASTRGLFVDRNRTILILYNIGLTMDFYKSIIGEILGVDSEFYQVIEDSCRKVYEVFFSRVKDRIKHIDLGYNPDNTISNDLKSFLSILGDIIQRYSTSLVPTAIRETDFLPILTSFLDPLIHRMKHETEKNYIFHMNVIYEMLQTLETFEFTKSSSRYETLKLQIENLCKTCSEMEAGRLLSNCGPNGLEPSLISLQGFSSTFELGIVDFKHYKQIKDESLQQRILQLLFGELMNSYSSAYSLAKSNGVQLQSIKTPKQISEVLGQCLK